MGGDGCCQFSCGVYHKEWYRTSDGRLVHSDQDMTEEFIEECKANIDFFEEGCFTYEYRRHDVWNRSGGNGIPLCSELMSISKRFPSVEICVDYTDLFSDLDGEYTLTNGRMTRHNQRSIHDKNWKDAGGDEIILENLLGQILDEHEEFENKEDIVKYFKESNDDCIEDIDDWCYQMDIPEQEDRVTALFKFFLKEN